MNEDFVPKEIALKLKEKGFREKCIKHYYPNSTDWFISSVPECGNYSSYVDIPTISQVLKWLRNEKKIYCLPHFEQGIDMWLFCIERPQAGCEFSEYISESIYDTYEQAALASIEYVLDNLI